MSHTWCFSAILSRRNLSLVSLLFNSVAGQRPVLERGRQDSQEPAGNHYGLLLQTGIVAKFEKFLLFFNGLRLTTYFAMLWLSLGFIHQIFSEKSGAQVSDQRNSKHAVHFKSANQHSSRSVKNPVPGRVGYLKRNGHKALIG